jgi:hemerythrin-like metal-binding protein
MSGAFPLRRGYWSPRLTLGLPDIDASHRELLNELSRQQQAPDAEFAACYGRFVAQVERDFRDEEDLMESMQFVGLPSHREQHCRVLGGLHHVARQVMEGNLDAGREAVALMPGWFLLHMETMDSAMALAAQMAQADD